MSTSHVSHHKNPAQEFTLSFFIHLLIKLLRFLEKFEDLKVMLGGFLYS